ITILAALMVVGISATLADAPIDGRSGRAEVRFLEDMIDHHQMALDMANDCLEKAEAESVRALCTQIIADQSAEIELMHGWLLAWYNVAYAPMSMMEMMPPAPAAGGHAGHAGHGGMAMPDSDPAMMMGMFAGLNRLQGRAYDIAWLEAMIDHHDDALHMSERILTRAQHAELIALANRIISAQSAEIALMETIIEELNTDG
ncbi:MAG: hypothetical protein CUN53_02350, partial [Phototrophicales bacterium]